VTSKDDEVRQVTVQVTGLLDELKVTVAALQAVLAGPQDEPPVEVA
jgi:hypothetical protein